MNEIDIIKIGCVIASAIGLLLVTQIYKPQIIEKTCDIINNNIVMPVDNLKYEQIENFYNCITISTISTVAIITISCIIAFAGNVVSNVDPFVITLADPSLIYVSQKLELINELDFIKNLHITKNFLDSVDPGIILQKENLGIICKLKSCVTQIPIPLMHDILIEKFNSIDESKSMQFMNLLEKLNYGILNFQYNRIRLEPEIGINFINQLSSDELIDYVNLYLYSLLKVSTDPLVLSQYSNIDLNYLNNYLNLIDFLNDYIVDINSEDDKFNMELLKTMEGVLSYLINDSNFYTKGFSVDINSINLALRYLAWADLIHQIDIQHSSQYIKEISALNNAPIDFFKIPYAFEELISTPGGQEVYNYFKNVFIASKR